MPDNNSFTLDDFVSDPTTSVAGGDPHDPGTTTVPDPVMADIDSIFGEPGDTSSGGSKKKTSSDNPPSKPQDGEVFGLPKNPQIPLSKLQSERDKYKADNERMTKELQQYKSVADFTSSLWDDAEARHAFIATLEPDLVKPKDPLTFVKEELKKEFGEGFSPNAEDVDPIQAQLYNARMQELYGEWKNKGKELPKDLKELRARRSAAAKKAQSEAQAVKRKIVEDFKWDDAAWEEFTQWGSGFTLYHLAKVFSKAKGNKRASAPPLPLNRGGSPLAGSQYREHLDNMFGPDLM